MAALVYWLGLTDPAGGPYLFWSGVGADLGMFVAVGVFVRRHNCHTPWCLRLGRHPVEGTAYVVCRRHHPHPGGAR